jgi:hypothetical protein
VSDHIDERGMSDPTLEAARGDVRAVEGAGQPENLDALFAGIEAAVEAEVGPRARLRALSTPTRRSLVAGGVGALAVGSLVVMPRPDLAVYPTLRLSLELLTAAALSAALVVVGIDRRLTAGLRPAHGLVLAAALLLPWVVGVLPVPHTGHPASLLGVGDDFIPRVRGCLMLGVVAALPVVALLRVLDREDNPRPARDVLHGALAGIAGLAAVHLHCPLTSHAHLLAGHGPTPLLLAQLVPAGLTGWATLAHRRRRTPNSRR